MTDESIDETHLGAELRHVEEVLRAGMQSAVPDDLRIHFLRAAADEIRAIRRRITPG